MTTSTLTLTDFLLARIAEDEAVAERAAGAHRTSKWTLDGGIYAGHPVDEVVDWVYGDASEHIARHDPARVLAECKAKRTIVGMTDARREELWAMGMDEHRLSFDEWASKRPCDPTLRALASIYADHPDYDPAWS